jgi:hypothetical protein
MDPGSDPDPENLTESKNFRGNVSYLFGVADPGWVKSQDPDMGSGMKLDPESGKQPGSATLRKP